MVRSLWSSPLCSLLTSDDRNGRLKRFSTKLQPWLIQFKYLPGTENTFADALSRQDWIRSVGEEAAGREEPRNSRQREDEDEETSAKTKTQGKREEETGAIGMP